MVVAGGRGLLVTWARVVEVERERSIVIVVVSRYRERDVGVQALLLPIIQRCETLGGGEVKRNIFVMARVLREKRILKY